MRTKQTLVVVSTLALVNCMESATPQAAPDASIDSAIRDVRSEPIIKPISDTGPQQDNCAPGDPGAFMSNGLHPSNAHQALCSDQQIGDYFSKCYDKTTATMASCSAFIKDAANTSCIGCLETPDTAKSWGAMVSGGGVVRVNVAGCVSILGNTGCATAYQDADDCVVDVGAGCQFCSFEGYGACMEAAAKACKSWNDKEAAACTINDASVASACTDHTTFADSYAAIAPIFCGGAGGDGGAD